MHSPGYKYKVKNVMYSLLKSRVCVCRTATKTIYHELSFE